MNKDKQIENIRQIEEMAKDLENHTCMSQFQAEIASRMLHIKGYRKASEVAREIFEEIEKLSHRFMNDEDYTFADMVWDIDELKRKCEVTNDEQR